MKVFKELDNGVYLLEKGPLAALSDNNNGCVALAFITEDCAREFINNQIEAFSTRCINIPEIKPIDDSYEFMQLCSKHGLAGIELLSEDEQKSFIFCVRLEEISSTLPTALSFNHNGVSSIKTRFKEFRETTYRSIKEWQRFDILDKVSAKFAVNVPFRNWSKRTLYEIRTNSGGFLSLFHVPCLHNFNSLDGCVPFFTTIELAINIINTPEFRNHLMIFEGFKSKFNEIAIEIPFSANFKIVRIDDVRGRIREFNNPFMGYVINPNGPRDSTGYGRFSIGDKNYEPLFYGVSGNWKVHGNNNFEKIEEKNCWNGSDSFFWSTVNAFKLNPLDRSFSIESSTSKYSTLSEYDIEDFVEKIFEDKEFEESEVMQAKYYTLEEEKLKSFSVIWWDPVTGDGIEDPIYFDSILDLITWLWQYECCRDFPIRKVGAHQNNGLIGIPATHDKELEEIIHLKIRKLFIKIYKRILLEGYKPKFGDDLSCIINNYFRTLHIDLLGYTKDVLFQLDKEEQIKVLSLLSITEEFVSKEFIDSYNQLDEPGSSLGIKILGLSFWNKLSNRAKYFISSSLSQLELLGSSPQLDYSMVSIGFVKALEYELGKIFENFALSTDLTTVKYDENDYGEKALYYLSVNKGGKLPALGSMGRLINPTKRDNSELRSLLGKYLDNLNFGEFLTSKKFWKSGIYKITERYRNGGAHDSAIPLKTAIECKDYILGSEKEDGVLKKILN